MSNYFEKYKRRNLKQYDTILDKERSDLITDFEYYLTHEALNAYEIQYTKPDELINKETNSTERMVIKDVADNDKTAFDEKYLVCRLDCPIDVGSYVYWNGSYYILEFEEVITTMTHKKYTLRRCNQYFNIGYKGNIYHIPVNVTNLTMYSKGIHDYKYISNLDAKRTILVGANPVTSSLVVGSRLMGKDKQAYKITHKNDFEYTRRRDEKDGLIKWLILETAQLVEDDNENLVAYNPINESDGEQNKIYGNDRIHIGEESTYTIKYDKEVTFELDYDYEFCRITLNENNSCTLSVDLDFDVIGEVISLIVKDKDNNETIDILNIVVRGLGAY